MDAELRRLERRLTRKDPAAYAQMEALLRRSGLKRFELYKGLYGALSDISGLTTREIIKAFSNFRYINLAAVFGSDEALDIIPNPIVPIFPEKNQSFATEDEREEFYRDYRIESFCLDINVYRDTNRVYPIARSFVANDLFCIWDIIAESDTTPWYFLLQETPNKYSFAEALAFTKPRIPDELTKEYFYKTFGGPGHRKPFHSTDPLRDNQHVGDPWYPLVIYHFMRDDQWVYDDQESLDDLWITTGDYELDLANQLLERAYL